MKNVACIETACFCKMPNITFCGVLAWGTCAELSPADMKLEINEQGVVGLGFRVRV